MPEAEHLFDYDDPRITTLQRKIIERRKKELSEEDKLKRQYALDIKRVNFLKFLKRVDQDKQITDAQF